MNSQYSLHINNLTLTREHASGLTVQHQIDQPQWIGLLGINGAGKTTLLNAIAGQQKNIAGDVSIGGFSLKQQLPQYLSCLGYMPDTLPASDDYTVDYFLTLIAIAKTGSRAALQAAPVKALLDQSLNKRKLSQCSLGQRQKINLAQALLGNPICLLLDEPTNGLDPAQRQWFWQHLEDVARDKTLLISSHQHQDLLEHCQRLWLMDAGKLVADIPLKTGLYISACSATDSTDSEVLIWQEKHSMQDYCERQQQPGRHCLGGTPEQLLTALFQQQSQGSWQW